MSRRTSRRLPLMAKHRPSPVTPWSVSTNTRTASVERISKVADRIGRGSGRRTISVRRAVIFTLTLPSITQDGRFEGLGTSHHGQVQTSFSRQALIGAPATRGETKAHAFAFAPYCSTCT